MASTTAATAEHNPTPQELAWAKRLKIAAQAAGSGVRHEEVSDWEFLQHAIAAKLDTQKGLQRLLHLQAFKRRYGILRDGSVEEAARDLRTFLQTHPGLYLSLADQCVPPPPEENEDEDNSTPHQANKNYPRATQIFCSEYQYFQAARMKSEEAFNIYMRAAFYTLQASQYSLEAVRAGLLLLMDVHGALKYRSFETERRARELYGKAYPIRIQGVVLLRSSRFLRMAYKFLLRPWLSSKVKELLRMPPPSAQEDTYYVDACGVPVSTLPQAWGGTLDAEDFHQTVLDRLRQRYQMEASFRL